MNYIGIDIGSTAAKTAVLQNEKWSFFTIPTGWSSLETAQAIKNRLQDEGLNLSDKDSVSIGSTGYGRNAVDFADEIITEITCHGLGASYLAEAKDCTVIDVGGQDTKVISMENGRVSDFLMNDKCAAGTGKFVEIMANRLNVPIDDLFSMAERGKRLSISSLCTVFAESEVINYIGSGAEKEDIAAGIADSVAAKVAGMCAKRKLSDCVILTGGLSQNQFFAQLLGEKIKRKILLHPDGRYAGAMGAALKCKNK